MPGRRGNQNCSFWSIAIQIYELTDICFCAQLIVFAKYVYNDTFKEKLFFCSPLETTTKAPDVLEKVSTFFESENLEWKNLADYCTDGALSMLGCHSGFQASVKRKAPTSKVVHCMLQRQVLAFKTLPNTLQKVLDEMIQIVNFIKAGALNS